MNPSTVFVVPSSVHVSANPSSTELMFIGSENINLTVEDINTLIESSAGITSFIEGAVSSRGTVLKSNQIQPLSHFL